MRLKPKSLQPGSCHSNNRASGASERDGAAAPHVLHAFFLGTVAFFAQAAVLGLCLVVSTVYLGLGLGFAAGRSSQHLGQYRHLAERISLGLVGFVGRLACVAVKTIQRPQSLAKRLHGLVWDSEAVSKCR